jgi:hypothetical protein
LKAQELRIGNFYDHNGEYKQVTPNTIEEVWEAQRTWCKPIPLTEDLVKKTNLENNNGEYYFKDTHLYLDFSLGKCMLCHFSGDSFRELKYLHELQNIYFCLMEEELTINI